MSWISQAAPGPVSVPLFQPVRPLPAVQFKVERVNVEHSVPMYAPELVSTVSGLNQPSDNLLHHCYAHLYLKVRKTLSLPSHSVSWASINYTFVLSSELFQSHFLHLHKILSHLCVAIIYAHYSPSSIGQQHGRSLKHP